MIIDGRALAEKMLATTAMQVSDLSYTPKLGVVTCDPNLETKQYLELKRQKAQQVGIELVVLELPDFATTEDCIASVNRLAEDAHGVLVQLPLPTTIDRERVLDAIPVHKDPDGFAYGRDERSVLPPVAAAIEIIATEYDVTFANQTVVVLGNGRLVGRPAAQYAETLGAQVTVLEENTADYDAVLRAADIVITGVGQPHFVTSTMLKDGVIVFDAGASEDGGVVVGDVDPSVAKTASLFTPVPGGIGPITVSALLDNLLKLISR